MENEDVATKTPTTGGNGNGKQVNGAFASSLFRNNKKIRTDRANIIVQGAQTLYKREVEDLELALEQNIMERTNLLDLSPTNSQSLILASDFNTKDFIAKDLSLSLKIRDLKIKLEVARERYNELFVLPVVESE